MAVTLRLTRLGAKKRPYYRMVAADSRYPRDGRFLETLGTYDPKAEGNNVTLDEDRVKHWLSVGAVPTDTVRSILKQKKLV